MKQEAVTFWFLALAYYLTLKMEATFLSETLVNFQRTKIYYIPEERNLPLNTMYCISSTVNNIKFILRFLLKNQKIHISNIVKIKIFERLLFYRLITNCTNLLSCFMFKPSICVIRPCFANTRLTATQLPSLPFVKGDNLQNLNFSTIYEPHKA
jgi:hypothetical protein